MTDPSRVHKIPNSLLDNNTDDPDNGGSMRAHEVASPFGQINSTPNSMSSSLCSMSTERREGKNYQKYSLEGENIRLNSKLDEAKQEIQEQNQEIRRLNAKVIELLEKKEMEMKETNDRLYKTLSRRSEGNGMVGFKYFNQKLCIIKQNNSMQS